MTTIAIIGAGNMGASLLGGLIANQYAPQKLFISDNDSQKLQHLQQSFNVHITTNNLEAIKSAEVIILAVKPQIILNIAKEISALVQEKKPLVISIAAGVREASLQKMLGGQIPIVRCMPNTPALIRCGASALYANEFVTPEQSHLAENILQAVGITVWLDKETDMDTVTALSGSGPAYFFLMMESLQSAAETAGLSAETARLLTLQTAFGASRMALESEKSLVELRKGVTSPGGTTEKALQVLEEGRIRELFFKAIMAAKNRAEELGEVPLSI